MWQRITRFLVKVLLLFFASILGSVVGILPGLKEGFIKCNHDLWGCREGWLFGLLVVVPLGQVYAFPGLYLAYFPGSNWAWKNSKRKLWLFLAAGTSAGVIDCLFVKPPGGYAQTIPIFALASFATALFHWMMLSSVEKRKPHYLS